MKRNHLLVKSIIIFFFLILGCQSGNETADLNESIDESKQERKPVELTRSSPAAYIQQTVGRSTIIVNYSRPSVMASNGTDRTGKIWGRLVPYDFNLRNIMSSGKPIPWRAGANENTTITLSHNAKIEGESLNAGTYGLHMAIHRNDSATLIFSNINDAWGSFSYKEVDDALRVKVATQKIPLTERLNYHFLNITKTSSMLVLDWEYKRIPVKIEFDTHAMVLGDFREFIADTTGLTWGDYNRAASYCADNNVNNEEGMEWVEQSIALVENYKNLSTKSKLLDNMGLMDEASLLKEKALALPGTQPNDYYSYGTQLIGQCKTDEAMEIFEKLQAKWPEHWLTAHGFGRFYAASGDFDTAIRYEKEALEKAPVVNKGYIEWAITKLETGEDFN